MSALYLTRNNAPALAYRKQEGENKALPTVLFLTGFRSDMEGTKAAYLAEQCASRGQTYVRFDYRGHGVSEGKFEDGTIGLWKQDALDILDHLTEGPVILVGSSMGGWISLLVAEERPERVTGLIGLAAAPDFTREVIEELNEDQKRELQVQGYCAIPNEYSDTPYIFTKALIEDGEQYCLLDRDIRINAPVRLIQGMKDADVPWQKAHRINNALTSGNKEVYLLEEGDHRLSRPQDLELLGQLVADLS
jgi:pimeloyl-ACP methyl ester carboxylesterase